MSKLTDKKAAKIAEAMQELGYECAPDQVREVRDGETISDNAALAANILIELEQQEIDHKHAEVNE